MSEKKFIPKKIVKTIDGFFKILDKLSIKHPYLVVLVLHEYYRILYSVDNHIPFKKKDPVSRINDSLKTLIEFSKLSLDIGSYNVGYTKNILRKILQEYLPDKIRLDRKKVGFNASILDVVDINYENFSYLIKKNYFMKKNLNMDKFIFLKNKKRNISNSESKLLFNIINTCIFYDTFS